MLEPRFGKRTVGCFVVGQFPNDFHFRACMGEHIHKVIDHEIDVVVFNLVELVVQSLTRLQVGDFVVTPPALFAEAF